jgi:PD-(D/E)XK nuclease superfamily protein
MEGEWSTNDKGAIAEIEIARAAIRAGIPVWRPLMEHARADVALELEGKLLRVQCKWGRLEDGVIKARLGTSRCTPNGHVRTTYTPDEVEAIAIYCPDLDKCYFLPISLVAGQSYIHLRVKPSRNNQSLGLKWAAHYEFGAIAQLGERLAGSQKVAGSSPASSTQLVLEK